MSALRAILLKARDRLQGEQDDLNAEMAFHDRAFKERREKWQENQRAIGELSGAIDAIGDREAVAK